MLPCLLLSTLPAWPAGTEEDVGSALGAVLPLTGRKEVSLLVIKDLWFVTGYLLSPPLLQPSGDIVHVDLGSFSVLIQSLATSAAQCTPKCARKNE